MNSKTIENALTDTGKYLFSMAGQLKQPQFSIKDIGIRHQQVNNWRVQKVLLSNEAKGRKGQDPFSLMDYIWIRMLEDLREIGVHVPLIKKAREELLRIAPFEQLIFKPEFLEDSSKRDELLNSIQEQLTVFDFLVINAIAQKEHLAVFIDELGQVHPYSSTDPIAWVDDAQIKSIMIRPFVSISVSEIMKEIIDIGDAENDDRRLVLITEEEREVLDMIREGQLSELRVRFDQNHEIDLIEATTTEKVNLKDRFVDVITRGGYQNISFTTQRGKVVHFKNTARIRPRGKMKK